MPSIVPNYVYTLFASIVVGALIIVSSGLSTVNVRREAETQHLTNLAESVAVESLELVSAAKMDNMTSKLSLCLPHAVGSQRYWLQIANDSAQAWVEVGFGQTPYSSGQRVQIPSAVSASGTFVSGSGVPILECHSDSSGVRLVLSGGS